MPEDGAPQGAEEETDPEGGEGRQSADETVLERKEQLVDPLAASP